MVKVHGCLVKFLLKQTLSFSLHALDSW